MFDKEFGFPNWLASEKQVVRTATGNNLLGCVTTLSDGSSVILSGAVYPANDATAIGIVYNKVDVTESNKPVAILVEGYVFEERLPEPLAEAAITALKEIKLVEYNDTEA